MHPRAYSFGPLRSFPEELTLFHFFLSRLLIDRVRECSNSFRLRKISSEFMLVYIELEIAASSNRLSDLKDY